MSETLTAANLNERVYDELRTRVLTRQEPAGRSSASTCSPPSSACRAAPFITR